MADASGSYRVASAADGLTRFYSYRTSRSTAHRRGGRGEEALAPFVARAGVT